MHTSQVDSVPNSRLQVNRMNADTQGKPLKKRNQEIGK